jgi:hypothetical protein
MLSNCTDMRGSETAVQAANGDVIRIPGPTEGSAVILQGRHVTHQALRPAGAQERITAVTSWRPRSPFVQDESVLTTVRPVSDLNELYFEFVAYRLDMMEQLIKQFQTSTRAHRRMGEKFDTACAKHFLQGLCQLADHTDHELVVKEEIRKGFVDVRLDGK